MIIWDSKMHFKALAQSLNQEKANKKMAFAEFPLRNVVPSFRNLTFFYTVTLSHLKGVSNRYFLNHINK